MREGMQHHDGEDDRFGLTKRHECGMKESYWIRVLWNAEWLYVRMVGKRGGMRRRVVCKQIMAQECVCKVHGFA